MIAHYNLLIHWNLLAFSTIQSIGLHLNSPCMTRCSKSSKKQKRKIENVRLAAFMVSMVIRVFTRCKGCPKKRRLDVHYVQHGLINLWGQFKNRKNYLTSRCSCNKKEIFGLCICFEKIKYNSGKFLLCDCAQLISGTIILCGWFCWKGGVKLTSCIIPMCDVVLQHKKFN